MNYLTLIFQIILQDSQESNAVCGQPELAIIANQAINFNQ